ncbi:hypothetical protein D6821_00775 [Candidatus Parcubacteria bacterium]|nr:MAG: hypothetical protein D6821_00775 [Candidatus Parcubacteria bacterium]
MIYFLLAAVAVLATLALFFIEQFFQVLFAGYAPFYSTHKKALKKIVANLNFKDNCIIYELGCGNAGFLRLIEKQHPEVKQLVGVEYYWWPFLLAKIQLALRGSKIKIVRRNLFDINLKNVNIIYCYLNQPMMDKLEKKFQQECQSGTQIVSYQYPLKNHSPFKVLEVASGRQQRKIYFYSW